MPDHTPHQKRIIRDYYEHRSELMLQKLAEIVSELAIEDSEAKRRTLWSRAERALRNLRVPSHRIAKILESHDPNLLAEVVRDFF
jgi:hypothetical protein